jgi:two-component system sensor histidine kinase/response regulator
MSVPSNAPLSRVPRAIAASSSLEAAPFGVLWVDPHGTLGFSNPKAAELLGVTPAEIVGSEIHQWNALWTRAEWEGVVWPAAGQTPYCQPGSWKHGSGTQLLDATVTRLLVAGQAFAVIYLSLAQTQNSAPAAGDPSGWNRSLSGFLSDLPCGVCCLDSELRILRMNPTLCAILGSEEAQLVGKPVASVLNPYKSDQVRWEEIREKRLHEWAFEYRNPSGRRFDLVVSSHLQPLRGTEEVFWISVQDLSERAQLKRLLSEHTHSFEHLARNTPGMIYKFVISPDGKASFPYASPGSRDIWEVDPEEVRDDASPIVKLVHPEDLGSFQSSVMKSASELSEWQFEGRLITPSGKLKWWHAASRPELAENGDIVWQGVLMDITHQKTIEEELQQAKLKAESSARSKADFLANMSHEIRTPMNGVIGMAELLARTPLQPRQQHYVDTIRSSAEVLLTIINDILDISKMEAGKLLINQSFFDLRQTLEDVAMLLAPRAFEKGLEFVLRFDPRTPQRVEGDFVRIRQILTNLIGNAIKFTSRGHILVKVEEIQRLENFSTLKISVEDTGVGISPEALPRLFQKFEQEDASTSRKFGGTGLGLSISKQLVELMGGRMHVHTELNRGSAFSFELKLAVGDAPLDDDVSAFDWSSLRILSVDDHPVNLELHSHLFETWGIQHTEVSTPFDALEALRKARASGQPFHLLVSDFLMPEMDGASLAAAIRAEPEIGDLEILLLSSCNVTDDQQRQLALSRVSAILSKPLRQLELRQAIRNALDSASGRRKEKSYDEVSVVDPKIARVCEADSTAAFPFATTPPPPPETASSNHPASPSSSPRVLLAEDNDVNVEIVREMLESSGFEVDRAANGLEAVELYRKNRHSVILMDCQMPEMDGFEATRLIREGQDLIQPVIIALTAHAMAGDRERCLSAGMDDYLAKPVKFSDLSQTLARSFEEASKRASASSAKAVPRPAPAEQPTSEPLPPSFDREAALAVTGGREDILMKAVAIWWKKVPDWLAEIKAAFARADVVEITRVAHSVKGSAGTIGALAVSELAKTLEKETNLKNLSQMQSCFDRLILEVEKLRDALAKHGI